MIEISVSDRYRDDPAISLLAYDQFEREVKYLRQEKDATSDEEMMRLLQRVVRGNAERSKVCPNQWYLSLAKHARDELVALCQPMVLGIASKVVRRAPRGVSLEVLDLVSEGNVSLLRLLDEKLPEDINGNYSGAHATGKGDPAKTAAIAPSIERPCLRMVER